MSRVSVITATTGRPALLKCIESVANQTHKDVQHLVMVDGPESSKRIGELFLIWPASSVQPQFINLPYSVGRDRWNGHRAYGAGTFLADDKSEYIMFLDDDNTIDPNHIESCLNAMASQPTASWAYSLRKIVDEQGQFICNDDCESLGIWPSVLHPQDHFVDVNCWFLPRKLAVAITPLWYRKFREPGQPEIDRIITANLLHYARQMSGQVICTKQYTVNYAIGSSPLSVQGEFFIKGNAEMLRRHNGVLPWTA